MSKNAGDVTAEPVRQGMTALPLAPIADAKRIDAMDILRGIALVGILLMNVEWFGRSIGEIGSFDASLSGMDHATGWLVRCFVEGKFYKMFALLFGMGFAVMLIRAREVGKPFGAWFTRRMLVLFAFGMLHMTFLWGGDILHDYAFAGLLFLGWIYLIQTKPFRRFDSPRMFLRVGIVWMFAPFVVAATAALVFGTSFDPAEIAAQWKEEQRIVALVDARLESSPAESDQSLSDNPAPANDGSKIESEVLTGAVETATSTGDQPDAPGETQEAELSDEEQLEQTVNEIVERKRERNKHIAEEIDAFTNASYWQATEFRFRDGLSRTAFTPTFSLLILMPIFLIGYWFVSSGTLRNHTRNQHIFRPMALLGMTFGLFFTIGGLSVMQHPASEISDILQATGGTLFFFGQYVLCAGYLGSIVILLGNPAWSKRLNRFAPMGRMALTNYIMDTVILVVIFHGYAGGLFGQISRAPQMLIVTAIVIFQFYFSGWWLARFRFGPLEWLWRSLTYKSVQPMRIGS